MKLLLLILTAGTCVFGQVADDLAARRGDGYRGIWYMNQPTKDEHRYKYSGGFATYPQQHAPIAIYAAKVERTFFVYGGSAGKVSESGDELEHMVSFFDHKTGRVSRPVRVLLKRTEDAHDNPVLSIDGKGYLYVFSPAHGTSRPSYVHRSKRPYEIDEWELIEKSNFSYPQPWYLAGLGRFLFLHTLYKGGERTLHYKWSAVGAGWNAARLLAHIETGDYQVSWPNGGKLGTAFDMHPSSGRGRGLNYRTNLYYAETADGGETWRTAAGVQLELPLRSADNPALVHDYRAEDLNVYMKDIAYDGEGRPVILYLTSKGYEPGPKSGPFVWKTARWTGKEWVRRKVTESDHNYDHGSLYIESGGTWRVIAPTDAGPQKWGTGGGVVVWVSKDEGQSWTRARTLTSGGAFNHTYVRKPLNAHAGFYALWADGSPLGPSPSSLYFANKDGDVFRLPQRMTGEWAAPERVKAGAIR